MNKHDNHADLNVQIYVEKPIPWLRSCAYRRARGLLARAVNLDTLGMDHTLSVAASVSEGKRKSYEGR